MERIEIRLQCTRMAVDLLARASSVPTVDQVKTVAGALEAHVLAAGGSAQASSGTSASKPDGKR